MLSSIERLNVLRADENDEEMNSRFSQMDKKRAFALSEGQIVLGREGSNVVMRHSATPTARALAAQAFCCLLCDLCVPCVCITPCASVCVPRHHEACALLLCALLVPRSGDALLTECTKLTGCTNCSGGAAAWFRRCRC